MNKRLKRDYERYLNIIYKCGGAVKMNDLDFLLNIEYKELIDKNELKEYKYDKVTRDIRLLEDLIDQEEINEIDIYTSTLITKHKKPENCKYIVLTSEGWYHFTQRGRPEVNIDNRSVKSNIKIQAFKNIVNKDKVINDSKYRDYIKNKFTNYLNARLSYYEYSQLVLGKWREITEFNRGYDAYKKSGYYKFKTLTEICDDEKVDVNLKETIIRFLELLQLKDIIISDMKYLSEEKKIYAKVIYLKSDKVTHNKLGETIDSILSIFEILKDIGKVEYGSYVGMNQSTTFCFDIDIVNDEFINIKNDFDISYKYRRRYENKYAHGSGVATCLDGTIKSYKDCNIIKEINLFKLEKDYSLTHYKKD